MEKILQELLEAL